MSAPAVTRQRRPFLAPLWVVVLAMALLGAFALAVHHSASTTLVLLVRIATRDAAHIDDPPLSAEGEERAQRLARLLATHSAPEAIYVTDERRAQQTAVPLAQRLHKAPVMLPAAAADSAAARLLGEHRNGVVVVITGAGAAAQILRDLCGSDVAAVRDEGDMLYVISVPTYGPPRLVALAL